MKILQFGTGRFLRGFFDPIVAIPRSVTVVQSLPHSRGADTINNADGPYHLWTRGKLNGEIVDRVEQVASLEGALIAAVDWARLQELACDSDLGLVVSNTTEKGLSLDPEDARESDPAVACPASFPAKLLGLLLARFRAGQPGLAVLPMELVEYNGDVLKQLVLKQSSFWEATRESSFQNWLATEIRWLNNLVDRIVVGVTDPPPWTAEDPLAVVAEPFQLLAVQDDGGSRSAIPAHPMVSWVADLSGLFIRKVRILNGLHTAMVAHCMPQEFETVLQVMNDERQRTWIEELLAEEILPSLEARGLREESFARQTLERLENPFFQHRLADIANNHATKLQTRIAPIIADFQAAFGKPPTRLTLIMNSESRLNPTP